MSCGTTFDIMAVMFIMGLCGPFLCCTVKMVKFRPTVRLMSFWLDSQCDMSVLMVHICDKTPHMHTSISWAVVSNITLFRFIPSSFSLNRFPKYQINHLILHRYIGYSHCCCCPPLLFCHADNTGWRHSNMHMIIGEKPHEFRSDYSHSYYMVTYQTHIWSTATFASGSGLIWKGFFRTFVSSTEKSDLCHIKAEYQILSLHPGDFITQWRSGKFSL